jgi:hypothetical protein
MQPMIKQLMLGVISLHDSYLQGSNGSEFESFNECEFSGNLAMRCIQNLEKIKLKTFYVQEPILMRNDLEKKAILSHKILDALGAKVKTNYLKFAVDDGFQIFIPTLYGVMPFTTFAQEYEEIWKSEKIVIESFDIDQSLSNDFTKLNLISML